MKILLSLLAISVSAISFSQGKIDAPNRMLKASGGLITKPGTKAGQVTVYDLQNVASHKSIKEQAESLSKLMRINISVKKSETNQIEGFSYRCSDKEQAAVYVIYDQRNNNRLIYFPDENISVVNVASLNIPKNIPQAKIDARTAKEVARGLCYACGAGSSKHSSSLMGQKQTLEDLDLMVDIYYPMDVVPRMRTYLNTIGITPEIKVPYIRACREGWAPAPTNEYQKAIWDKVHAMPTAPIKIKPETKKIRE